ncbi:hypothetical protein EIP86_008166, partial [Pleurotus ostreatoroseus]
MASHVVNLLDTNSSAAGSEQFRIPDALYEILLPQDTTSITALLRYDRLPAPRVLSLEEVDLESWTSGAAPCSPDDSSLALSLPYCPLPPIEVARGLSMLAYQPAHPTLQSLYPAHLSEPISLPTSLPLWVATYWDQAHKVRQAQQLWRDSMNWLNIHTQGSATGRTLYTRILSALSELQWNGSLRGKEIASASVTSLTTLLSDKRLTGALISALTGVLQYKLNLASPIHHSRHSIVNLEFAETLLMACHTSAKELQEQPQFAMLRVTEIDLLSDFKDSVSGLVFDDSKKHFVFFVLNFKEQYLGYGDSLHGDLPADVKAALLWWIQRLQALQTSPTTSSSEPELHDRQQTDSWLRRLPVTNQSGGDTSSCGLLAINGLEHHLLPGTPLLNPDRRSVSMARMNTFLDIAKIHLNAISTRDNCAATRPTSYKVFSFATSFSSSHPSSASAEDVDSPARPSSTPLYSTASNDDDLVSSPSVIDVSDDDSENDQRSTPAKSSPSLGYLRQSTLSFKKITAEEKQAQSAADFADLHVMAQESRDREAQVQTSKDRKKREDGRIRQQRFRDLKRQREIDDGLRLPNGKKPK